MAYAWTRRLILAIQLKRCVELRALAKTPAYETVEGQEPEDGSIKRQEPAIDEQPAIDEPEGSSDEEPAPESCDTEKEVGDRAVQRMLLVLFLLYPSLSSTCFKFFSCRMLDSGEIYHVDDTT